MPREPYDHQERYLRDFFAGHFGATDADFVSAELANARVDPALAHRREQHEKSLETALEELRRLARGLAS
jgi:FMN-dependent NADH-azoreductase